VTRGYWPGDSGKQDLLYRPLATATYALQYALHGPRPLHFRLVNVLLHGIVCWLLFLFLRDLAGSPVALLAALLFCVHGVCVESVQYVIGRADLLAGLFVLLALLLYRRALLARGKGPWLVLVFVASLLSLLSKESAVCLLPLVALLHLHLRKKGGAPRAASPLCLLAPALGLAVALSLRAVVLGDLARAPADISLLDNPLAGLSFLARWRGSLVLLGQAARLLLVPFPQSTDYSLAALPVTEGLSFSLVAGGVVLVLLVVALRRGGDPALALGAVGFLCTFALPSQVLFPLGTVFGLRLLYLPAMAACLVLARLALLAGRRFPASRRGLAFAVCLCALQLPFAVSAVAMYRDEETLVRRSLRAAPESARLQYLYGGMLASKGKEAEARVHLEKALSLFPGIDAARAMLGMVRVRAGEVEEGAEEVLRAFRGSPALVLPSLPHLARELQKAGLAGKAREVLELHRQELAHQHLSSSEDRP
jgi:4-amino-4-deoxy-L-arabinose transferase-like glycosyltransferase